MSNQNCPRRCAQRFAAPGTASAPICATPRRAADACASAAACAPLRSAEEEMRICRYTNPIPIPADPAQSEVVCLLRRQNELLSEILAALQPYGATRA